METKRPYAYIYLITNLLNNKIYVGKKQLNFYKKVALSKKEKLLPENKRKRYKIIVTDGGWEKYYGSSQELKEDIKKYGIDNFKKEILQEVYSKSEASYWEGYWQFHFKVLEIDSYNKWISLKVYKNNLCSQL